MGVKEFEDAFADDILALALNDGYPKVTGTWQPEEVTKLRESKKISDALGKVIHDVPTVSSNHWGKPEFGKSIGRVCQSKDKIPSEVLALFELARNVAGVID